MNSRFIFCTAACLFSLAIGTTDAWAKKKKQQPKPVVELTEEGKALEAAYKASLDEIRSAIKARLPEIDPQALAAYKKAIEEEKAAAAAVGAAQANLGKVAKGRGLVGHAKGKWIGGAQKGIASTKAKLKEAKTPEEEYPVLNGWILERASDPLYRHRHTRRGAAPGCVRWRGYSGLFA